MFPFYGKKKKKKIFGFETTNVCIHTYFLSFLTLKPTTLLRLLRFFPFHRFFSPSCRLPLPHIVRRIEIDFPNESSFHYFHVVGIYISMLLINYFDYYQSVTFRFTFSKVYLSVYTHVHTHIFNVHV